ncbi:hypothetical protein MTR_8g009525 [Medicago truncatula]|uniref:Uncharacterized protein n=1 Tax=Medicago truncatula TaxID=3880 RepID=A0A072TMB9_MEDTR|nr:hypothetical protein MTR_8g009525 [Medicago truncatula]
MNEKFFTLLSEKKHGSEMNTMRSKRNRNRKRENKNWRENLREALPLRERGEKKE